MRDDDYTWKVLYSETIVDSQWMRLEKDTVRTPHGKELTWWTVARPDAAVILPLTENNEVILIGGYRHPIKQFLWEAPAGLNDKTDASLLDTARRELKEETGIKAKRWNKIASYPVAPGSHRQYIDIYLARDLTFGTPRPDDAENLVIKRLPLEEALALSHKERAVSGSTIVALYRAKELLEQENAL